MENKLIDDAITIYEAINKDRDLLVRLDAKMDLVLEKMKDTCND